MMLPFQFRQPDPSRPPCPSAVRRQRPAEWSGGPPTGQTTTTYASPTECLPLGDLEPSTCPSLPRSGHFGVPKRRSSRRPRERSGLRRTFVFRPMPCDLRAPGTPANHPGGTRACVPGSRAAPPRSLPGLPVPASSPSARPARSAASIVLSSSRPVRTSSSRLGAGFRAVIGGAGRLALVRHVLRADLGADAPIVPGGDIGAWSARRFRRPPDDLPLGANPISGVAVRTDSELSRGYGSGAGVPARGTPTTRFRTAARAIPAAPPTTTSSGLWAPR